MAKKKRNYNGKYAGDYNSKVAFPLGGIGAGMVCLEGTGCLSHVSIRHKPDVFNEPTAFAALSVKGRNGVARILEGPVPMWKAFGQAEAATGRMGRSYGLPRFDSADFKARFPFGTIQMKDTDIPLKVELTGWSPFIPGDADNSSLPVAALEYRFVNNGKKTVKAVYSFHSRNFLNQGEDGAVVPMKGGFVLQQMGKEQSSSACSLAAYVDEPGAKVDCQWFRGGWFDSLTMVWKGVEACDPTEKPPYTDNGPSPGGSVTVPLEVKPGKEKTIRLMLAWYAPETDMRYGPEPATECESDCDCSKSDEPMGYRAWYTGRFKDLNELTDYWRDSYDDLRTRSAAFSKCFYDTTLPDEVTEAISANLGILKSPTVLREKSGRLWTYEGCTDVTGCCHGSCTHVWNYAQAIPHLFPDLERSLRQTEYFESQTDNGHQWYRTSLPIRPTPQFEHAPADGQLGGIMKAYREWRISGDNDWLREFWPKIKQSLSYCIDLWDPEHNGVLVEPQWNTYDIAFWGPNGMLMSFYLGALKAAMQMGEALGENVPLYGELYEKGRRYIETELYNGEYFDQKIQWKELRAVDIADAGYTPEAKELLEKEGPKYQYGKGCLSDGVLGAWMAEVCGVGDILNPRKVEKHLLSVFRYNFRPDLSKHVNPQRPTYAFGKDAGLLLCSWPKSDKLSVPFVYSDEVWTGIEYQVAAHLMCFGHVKEGLRIVRGVRDRYDGRYRNPFNEYECGHWYARALSSYSLLQGMTGARYDAVAKVLYLAPTVKGDFRSFLSTAGGYGTVGVRKGKPFLQTKSGSIPVERIEYVPCK